MRLACNDSDPKAKKSFRQALCAIVMTLLTTSLATAQGPIYQYDFYKPGTTTVAASFRFPGFVRDVSPASTPIPGFTSFISPSPASLVPCDLTSNSSAELDCRAPTVHSGIFFFQFDYGAFPSKLGPFTGTGFTAPDGATPSIGTVPLLNGQVIAVPPGPIHGLVESLGLTSLKIEPPASQYGLLFEGWVNFSGANGYIEMDALKAGNGPSDTDALWERLESFKPDTTPRAFVNGENQYKWSVFPNKPFAQDRWPDGGTARFRFRAMVNPGSGFSETKAQLAVQDDQGVQGRIPELIFSDEDPTPATAPSNLQVKPLFLTAKPNPFEKLDTAATLNYYRTVATSPTGLGPSIADSLSTEQDFKNRYFGPIPSSCQFSRPEVSATYYNRGDLGLGREMHCMSNSCTKETACYVRNFGKQDGTPNFGDMPETLKAITANQPFATVAMVERGQMPLDAPNKVFFVVYPRITDPKCTGGLGCTAPLDNLRSNISIPTNCMVCHGAASTYLNQNPPLVKNAYFLPFDLQSFGYYSTDPSNRLSRPAQESAFAGLNQIVNFTDLFFNLDAHDLIEGWYPPLGLGSRFQDGFVPKGWAQDANAQQLYRQVVAPTCRTCHISHSPQAVVTGDPLRFSTFDDFQLNKALIIALACTSHSSTLSMPNAEQTSNIFWQGPARSQLLNRLAITSSGCGLNPPGSQHGALAITQLRRPALEVLRDYKTESCACTTTECLKGVENKYVQEIPAMQFDDPSAEGAISSVISEVVMCHQQVVPKGSSRPKSEEELRLERDLAARAKAFVH